jgi:biotin carboxyl carrier protein
MAESDTTAIAGTQPVIKRKPMARRTKIAFYVVAWLIVLMPFLFWRSTWFGRQLSDREIARYLRDDAKPRHIQHALVQVGERMARGDKGVGQWYPELVRLAGHPVEEIRSTDAWVMGQDTSYASFRRTLLTMLDDVAPTVRANAALSLVRFGDAAGRPQIVSMLQPLAVTAPAAGRVVAVAKAGDAANHGTLLAKLEDGSQAHEVRAPITGRISSVQSQRGSQVAAGQQLLVIDPGAEQVWEALRALYVVGQPEDLAAVRPYKATSPNRPKRIEEQAAATERAILQRAAR